MGSSDVSRRADSLDRLNSRINRPINIVCQTLLPHVSRDLMSILIINININWNPINININSFYPTPKGASLKAGYEKLRIDIIADRQKISTA